jgi:hypothetical protein
MPLCNEKAPDYIGEGIYCKRAEGHPGQHCNNTGGIEYDQCNIWWPVKEDKPGAQE